MADKFNRVFIEKVRNLKDKLTGPITADPAERLKVWLDKKDEHIPELNFHKLNEEDLMKNIQETKRKENCRI